MSSNAYYASDSHSKSPSQPSSPSTMQFVNQQAPGNSRSFINLAQDTRSHPPQPVKYQPYAPTEPPAGISYSAFLKTWKDEDVARWLNEIKCGSHDVTFKANDIRGDVLLELDEITLKEMGISILGDRLRILKAVRTLRQRVAGKPVPMGPSHKSNISIDDSKTHSDKTDSSGNRHGNRRLENVRPAPLQLNANAGRGDLPAIIREQGPDSARSTTTIPIRPLPHPTLSTPPSNTQLSTPSSSAHSVTPGLHRPHLPPLPPPPRGQPPLPPGRGSNRSLPSWNSSTQVEAPAYTSQPPPPPPHQNQGLLTPSSSSWVNHHLPADPRPGNPGSSKIPNSRSISPVPPARLRPNTSSNSHGRNGSIGLNNNGSPSKPTVRGGASNSHPYANVNAVLHPPSNLASSLSPIEETFSSHHNSSGTPSPPTHAYSVGRGPFNPGASNNNQYSLDDLRKKLVKFVLPDEGLSFTIDVASCTGGIEVLEKVLKKFGKGSLRSDGNMDVSHTDEGGLTVDGWGVFMDIGQEDGPGEYF